tara:strand:- start:3268 stop:3534 length:267 start_codon:yes stop_codon:yes gene_type:complete
MNRHLENAYASFAQAQRSFKAGNGYEGNQFMKMMTTNIQKYRAGWNAPSHGHILMHLDKWFNEANPSFYDDQQWLERGQRHMSYLNAA